MNKDKYTFQNEIIKKNSKTNEIWYRNHVQFGSVKPGQFFGYRALLDKQIIRRHIIEDSEIYSEQLGIYPEDIDKQIKLKKRNEQLN